jgi:hypothetical protein
MSDAWTRRAPLAGVVFVALLVASVLIGGNTPNSDASAQKVIAFYHSHSSRTQVSAYLNALSLFFGLVFFASLRRYLRRAPGLDWVAALAFGGAILFAVSGALFAGLHFALGDTPGRLDPGAAQALNVLSNDAGIAATIGGLSTLLLATGVVALRARLLPAWLGWVTIVMGVVALTPIAFAAFIAMAPWSLIVSILLYRREQGEVQAPATATPPTPAAAAASG